MTVVAGTMDMVIATASAALGLVQAGRLTLLASSLQSSTESAARCRPVP